MLPDAAMRTACFAGSCRLNGISYRLISRRPPYLRRNKPTDRSRLCLSRSKRLSIIRFCDAQRRRKLLDNSISTQEISHAKLNSDSSLPVGRVAVLNRANSRKNHHRQLQRGHDGEQLTHPAKSSGEQHSSYHRHMPRGDLYRQLCPIIDRRCRFRIRASHDAGGPRPRNLLDCRISRAVTRPDDGWRCVRGWVQGLQRVSIQRQHHREQHQQWR